MTNGKAFSPNVLSTDVTVPIGQTVVLGTAASTIPNAGARALILTVRPQMAHSQALARPATRLPVRRRGGYHQRYRQKEQRVQRADAHPTRGVRACSAHVAAATRNSFPVDLEGCENREIPIDRARRRARGSRARFRRTGTRRAAEVSATTPRRDDAATIRRADRARHHALRPDDAALHLRRRLDARARGRYAGRHARHGLPRARGAPPRTQARRRQRHVLPEHAGHGPHRERASSISAGGRRSRPTDFIVGRRQR